MGFLINFAYGKRLEWAKPGKLVLQKVQQNPSYVEKFSSWEIGRAWKIDTNFFPMYGYFFPIRFPSYGILYHIENTWLFPSISNGKMQQNAHL